MLIFHENVIDNYVVKNLPHKLDFKNVSDKPDIKLETYWYN